jgi:hypothetical protein
MCRAFFSWSSIRKRVRSATKAPRHSAAVEVKGAKKRFVGCWQSGDYQGSEEAVREG